MKSKWITQILTRAQMLFCLTLSALFLCLNVVAIAAGRYGTLALKSDGSLVAWA